MRTLQKLKTSVSKGTKEYFTKYNGVPSFLIKIHLMAVLVFPHADQNAFCWGFIRFTVLRASV